MAQYYVNLDSTDSGHVGSSGDPYSIIDVNNLASGSSIVTGDIFNVKGTLTSDASSSLVANVQQLDVGFTFKAWDSSAYGPWVINSSDANVVLRGNSSSGATVSGGIINQTYSSAAGVTLNTAYNCIVKSVSTITCLGSSIFKGSTFIASDINNNSHSYFTDCVIDASTFTNYGDFGSYNRDYSIVNCVLTAADPGFEVLPTTSSNNQYGWSSPTWPSTAVKGDWDLDTLLSGVTTPPEPGNPPYTNYTTDLWGDTRTGIGSGYMPPPVPISFTSTPDKTATEHVAYVYTPTTSKTAINFSLTGAPTGMAFDATTGVIHWTPSYDKTNSGPLALKAFSVDSSVEQDWTVAVNMVTPSITSTPTKIATEGVVYTYTPTTNALDLNYWGLTGAPSDATFTPSTGLLRWVPDATNSGSMRLTVYDRNGLSSYQDWTVAVTYVAPVITSTPDTTALQNTPYTYAPTVTEFAVKNWAISGVYPSSMTFDSRSGTIGWTPAFDDTGTGPIYLRVYDYSNLYADQTFSLTVAPRPKRTAVKNGAHNQVGPYGKFSEQLVWELDTTTNCLVGFRRVIS